MSIGQANHRFAESILYSLGYQPDYVKHDYRFAAVNGDDISSEVIDTAAFLSDPPSFRTACIGFTSRGQDDIYRFGYLGAPHVISMPLGQDMAQIWSFGNPESPEKVDEVERSRLHIYAQKQELWKPDAVFRAKSSNTAPNDSTDLYDFGLVPTIEKIIQEKLNSLLSKVVTFVIEDHKKIYQRNLSEIEYKNLFRVLFGFIAGKLLIDRQYPGEWHNQDASGLLRSVSGFYLKREFNFIDGFNSETLNSAWRMIHEGFPFQNISLETMAYVYENTFVDEQSRQIHGTHATPPAIAEYIVDHLPIDNLGLHQRKTFEPFSGHAPFLTAALSRIKQLLPKDLSREDRHKYLTKNIVGLEIDSFAREVAHYSLILADYPNPNDWSILNEDFFLSKRAESTLEDSDIILCNPPFGYFSAEERQIYGDIQYAEKPFEVLNRILDADPDMIGMVLPRKFLTNNSLKALRQRLMSMYNNIHLTTFPDNVFKFATVETVAISASRSKKTNKTTIYRSTVSRSEYKDFLSNKKVRSEKTYISTEVDSNSDLWSVSALDSLRILTQDMPRLADIARISRGVSYLKSKDEMLSTSPLPDHLLGIWNADDNFTPYSVKKIFYLDSSINNIDRGKSLLKNYNSPKVIVNHNAKSRGVWRLYAVPDERNLFFYHNFMGIWPENDISIYTLSAILNSSVVNAILSFGNGKGWHITKKDLGKIPIPRLTSKQNIHIEGLVKEYLAISEEKYETDYLYFTAQRKALQEIESKVFEIYGLNDDIIIDTLLYFVETGPDIRETDREDIYDLRSELVDKYFTSGLDYDEMRSLNYMDLIEDQEEEEFYFDAFALMSRENQEGGN